MRRMLLVPLLMAAVMMQACAAGLSAIAGPPPQLPPQVQTISRTALDFALNSFDAALYGIDFAVASGKLKPGSATAKKIAAAGRKVMGFLSVAEAARKVGNAASYEEAFSRAKAALAEFRALFPSATASSARPSLTNADRWIILGSLMLPSSAPDA